MRQIYLAFFALIILQGCIKPIVVDLPEHEPRIVLHCNLEDGDSVINVWVAQTVGILDTQYIGEYAYSESDSLKFAESNWIASANVKIYENGQLLAELQPQPHLRIYRAYLTAPLNAAGKTYEIVVSAAGYPQAEASLTFPKSPQYSNLSYRPLSAVTPDGSDMDAFSFTLNENSGTGDYYRFQLFSETRDTVMTGGYYIYSNELYSLNPMLELQEAGIVLSDLNIDGQNYNIEFLSYPLDTAVFNNSLHIISIDRASYLYEKSLMDYYNAYGNPFAEPVILYSNVKNGRGLFSACNRKIIPIL